MQTIINLDEELLTEAQRITGVKEQSTLIHAGLRALIGSEEAQRLACMGEAKPQSKEIRQPGSAKGLLKIVTEDNEHLDDFRDYMS